jgi:arylsulfatase A-like enzyme
MPTRKYSESTDSLQRQDRPNFLIMCMDQWQTHMRVPDEVEFPAMRRLEAQGVSFDRQYCTVPICTPSRASMWTGVHARHTGLWDNTNFAWIEGLDPKVPTIGQMLREQGYYTAFKGKWHLSELPHSEDALEANGFSDYQQWGDMFGAPLQGEQLDGVAVFETVDWLEHKAPQLDQPWLLVCSLINPHDIMYLQTDPIEAPEPNGFLIGKQTPAQRLGWFEKKWNLKLPDNFADDFRLQPFGVRHYKENMDKNYGRLPDDREDLWLARRNYLVNCMRLVDREFGRVLDALDRLKLWRNTVVLFMSDHGEMNGAHRMTQKGAIHFDEAAIVNLTACVPGGPQGKRAAAVGSHLDLAPTLLEFAGLSQDAISARYPHLKGRSLKSVMVDPDQDGPRGSAKAPGDGALFCWDGLNMLDIDWSLTGALQQLTDLPSEEDRQAHMQEVGRQHGAPDFKKRTLYRTLVDGRYKFVRWFAPDGGYGNPSTLEELYATSDVSLHDLEADPGEMENIGHPDHPRYDATLVDRLLKKLNALIEREIGEDLCPFDLNMFGTREVKYPRSGSQFAQTSSKRGAKRDLTKR